MTLQMPVHLGTLGVGSEAVVTGEAGDPMPERVQSPLSAWPSPGSARLATPSTLSAGALGDRRGSEFQSLKPLAPAQVTYLRA